VEQGGGLCSAWSPSVGSSWLSGHHRQAPLCLFAWTDACTVRYAVLAPLVLTCCTLPARTLTGVLVLCCCCMLLLFFGPCRRSQ
jgi:hypothetical protein